MIDITYKNLISEILDHGYDKDDRTGVGSRSIIGAQIKHDMADGFPLLTIRKVPYKTARVELEGFIKGINSKKWYQERGCKIWDEWCNPKKVPYGNDPETKAKMLAEDDLGLIYGNNWRRFRDPEVGMGGFYPQYVDQLKNLVDELKINSNSRRMMVCAWNPLALEYAALPACHDSWQVIVTGNKLNLIWRQRSVDVLLGLVSNVASYATLLHLLALESGYQEGILVGHLGDCHLYNNQLEVAKDILKHEPYESPKIITENFKSIFDWTHKDTKVIDYKYHPSVRVAVAV